MKTFHYGKYVESETPVTGVIQNNNVEWLNEEIDSGTDITWESFSEGKTEEELADVEWEQGTTIIGDWKKDSEGKWEPDKEGKKGFSAIVTFDPFYTTQVIWSKWTKRGNLCSPCFPGQVNLDSEGDYLGYTLPPDLIGFAEKNTKD